MTRAADIMTAHPITVPSSATIDDCGRLMSHLSLRNLLVVDDAGHLVGVLRDRDLCATGPTRLVKTVMTRDPITVAPDAEIHALARLMTERGLAALPILDEAGAIVGIVSYIDVLRGLADGLGYDDDLLDRMDANEPAAHPLPK